jgi:hypothetical protein
LATSGNPDDFVRPAPASWLDLVMRQLWAPALLATTLTFSGCTVLGAGAGAGIGYAVGNPLKGALIGGALGLRADIEMVKTGRELYKLIFFWT